MTLGVILAIGESWEDFIKKGQDSLFLENNLKQYSEHFDQVLVFSYGPISKKLLPNVYLIPNKYKLNRFIYSVLLPILNLKLIKTCDVIRGYQLTSIIPGLISKLVLKKPFILNYGYDYTKIARIEGQKIRQLLFIYLEKLLNFSDSVIVTTDSLQKYLLERDVTKTHLIPNSINTIVFRPIKLPNKYDLIFVGRLEKQKNLDLLLKACAQVNNRYPGLHILFIGQGTMKTNLVTLAKKLQLDLTVLSTVQNKDLPQYLNESKLFVLVSKLEGHPKALLEAMSCGLAVIGSEVEGIKSLIKHNKNGILVKAEVNDISNAICLLLSSPNSRSQLGKEARKYVKANFTTKIVWEKEIELLNQLSN